MKKQTKAQRKGKASSTTTTKGNNGLKRRREKRRDQGSHSIQDLRTHRPEELLSPAKLLSRFTERAQELIASLPEGERPVETSVSGALRQAVLEAFRSRDEYVARMVETDLAASAANQNADALRRSIRTALVNQGVLCVESPDEQDHFVVVEGEGEAFEVLRPAYVDQATGKLVLAGQLRRVPIFDDVARVPGGEEGEEGERT